MNKLNGTLKIFTIIVAVILYTSTAIAYLHSRFVDKDLLELIVDRLDRIENKIDAFLK